MIGRIVRSAQEEDRPPLVGRAREQALLSKNLGAALAGRGGLVLVGGEAGIGKTALAEALGREAVERGALALVGRCYDLAETPPYGPWAEALAHVRATPALPPELRARPQPGAAASASSAALFGQARDFLAAVAAQRPLVVLLDDLHWADPASLELLRFVARSGELTVSAKGPGRGVYTCRRLACFERATAHRSFNRTLRATVRVDPELARLYT